MTTLLLISEDKGLRRYLKKLLSEEAFNVLEAENPAEALQLTLKRQPRLILLDLDLSEEDEFSLLEKLDLLFKRPIIVLSAQHNPDYIIQILDAGASAYISKPFGEGELLARLRVVLRRTAVVAVKTG